MGESVYPSALLNLNMNGKKEVKPLDPIVDKIYINVFGPSVVVVAHRLSVRPVVRRIITYTVVRQIVH